MNRINLTISVLVLLTQLWISAFSYAESPQCAPVPSTSYPSIEFSSSVSEAVIRNNLPLAEIRELQKEKEAQNADSVMGLTTYDTKTSYSFEVRTTLASVNDRLCASTSKVRAGFFVVNLKVLIPSEYQEGSCEYREILSHENKHVEILKELHDKYSKILRKVLEDEQTKKSLSSVSLVKSIEEAQSEMKSALSFLIRPTLEEYENELRMKQSSIDTISEYQTISSRCNNWLSKQKVLLSR